MSFRCILIKFSTTVRALFVTGIFLASSISRIKIRCCTWVTKVFYLLRLAISNSIPELLRLHLPLGHFLSTFYRLIFNWFLYGCLIFITSFICLRGSNWNLLLYLLIDNSFCLRVKFFSFLDKHIFANFYMLFVRLLFKFPAAWGALMKLANILIVQAVILVLLFRRCLLPLRHLWLRGLLIVLRCPSFSLERHCFCLVVNLVIYGLKSFSVILIWILIISISFIFVLLLFNLLLVKFLFLILSLIFSHILLHFFLRLNSYLWFWLLLDIGLFLVFSLQLLLQ